jgi:hypothetical protein
MAETEVDTAHSTHVAGDKRVSTFGHETEVTSQTRKGADNLTADLIDNNEL